MTTLIAKELRENALWALMGLIGLSLITAYAFMPGLYAPGTTIVSDEFIGTAVVACCFAGLALGALLILQDRRRDRWDYLMHRPISRGRMFAGKLLAGLILYAVVVVPPFVGAVLWSAYGPVATPFEWRMALPGIADILLGIVWLIASLLACTRTARWYASRILPLGIAVFLAPVIGATLSYFWEAPVLVVIAIAILLPAAWSIYRSLGEYESQPTTPRAIQSFAVLFGMFLVWLCVIGLVAGTIDLLRPAQVVRHHYGMLKDGRFVREQNTANTSSLTDIHGQPVDGLTADSYWTSQAYFSQIDLRSERRSLLEKFFDGQLQQRFTYYDMVRWENDRPWYYVHAHRRFEQYDRRAGRMIATIGANGYVAAPALAESFPADLNRSIYWDNDDADQVHWSAEGVYRVNLRDQEIEKLYSAPAGLSIKGVAMPRLRHGHDDVAIPREQRTLVVLSSDNNLHVLRGKTELFAYPLQETTPRFDLLVTRIENGPVVLWYRHDYWGQIPQQVLKLDDSGKVIERIDLPPLPPPQNIDSTPATFVFVSGLPLVGHGLGYVLMWLAGERMWMIESSFIPALYTVVLLLAVACAAIAWWIARRYALGSGATLAWTLSAFFCCVPGLLTMLVMRDWPARIACPSCSRQRVVTRGTCEHCGAAVPPPARNRTEIFESHQAQPAVA